MGKVVKLEPQGKDRTGASRQKGSETALVLGGGGFTGGVYEIGALRALDLLTVNRTVNDFDIYVGTSAGAFVAAMTANGVTPEEMMRVVDHQRPTPFPDLDLANLLRPNITGFAKSALTLPSRTVQLLRGMVAQLGQVSAMDVVLGLAEGLPAGAYSGAGVERYLHGVLTSESSRSDDFRALVVGPAGASNALAARLRGTRADVVHADAPDTLHEIAATAAGGFDYASCSVLHAAGDVDAAIDALVALLKPTGALAIAVPATYARTGVEQLRSLVRLLDDGAESDVSMVRTNALRYVGSSSTTTTIAGPRLCASSGGTAISCSRKNSIRSLSSTRRRPVGVLWPLRCP